MEDVKNTIEANDLGEGDRVVLSGGEPCLSALFLDAVKYIMCKGLGITMLSNVSCFADIDFVKQLEDVVNKSRFDIITALHSSDAAVHDEITGCFGSHSTSLAAIGNLIQRGFHITIKHIVSKKTYKGLPLLARMISDKYPPTVDFQLTAMDFCGRDGRRFLLLSAIDCCGRAPRRGSFPVRACFRDSRKVKFRQKAILKTALYSKVYSSAFSLPF